MTAKFPINPRDVFFAFLSHNSKSIKVVPSSSPLEPVVVVFNKLEKPLRERFEINFFLPTFAARLRFLIKATQRDETRHRKAMAFAWIMRLFSLSLSRSSFKVFLLPPGLVSFVSFKHLSRADEANMLKAITAVHFSSPLFFPGASFRHIKVL